MKRLLLVLALTCAVGAVAPAQDVFPKVPTGPQRTVQSVIDELMRTLHISTNPWNESNWKWTRYEQAVVVYAAYRTLSEDRKIKRTLGAKYRDIVSTTRRLASTLEKELASLGVDVEELKRHLRALADGVGFADVSPSHWASEATLELKNAGILVGYPDGLFRGE